VNKSRIDGLIKSSRTRTALIAAITVITISDATRKRRLSTMSASAPAGTANRNIGRLLATWTRETVSGSGLRLVISHPEAALYIQVRIFATTVAVHTTVKVVWRKAIQGEARSSPAAAAGLLSERVMLCLMVRS